MLFLEVAVVLLIAWEIYRDECSRLAEKKKHRLFGERLALIREALDAGYELRRTVPVFMGDNNDVNAWLQALNGWFVHTHGILQSFSQQAGLTFAEGRPQSTSFPMVASGAEIPYAQLLLWLTNLQNIMEKPDVYF